MLIPELAVIYSNPSAKFEELWNNKKGLPCFIKLEKIGYNDCLLTASYYDSIKKQEDDKSSIINPLSERSINYEYFPLINKSSWLYIKAPSRFNIKYNHKETIFSEDNNEIDYANASNEEADPGIGLLKYNEKEFSENWCTTKTDGDDKGMLLVVEKKADVHINSDKRKKDNFSILIPYFLKYKKYFALLLLGLILGSIIKAIYLLIVCFFKLNFNLLLLQCVLYIGRI